MSRGSKEFLASLPGGGNMEAIRELLQQQLGNAPGGPPAGKPPRFSGSMPMIRDDGRRQALLDRAIKDPKKAFSALSKMAKNFSPEQKQQLQKGLNNIMGQRYDRSGGAEPGSMIGQNIDFNDPNAFEQAANIFGNFTGRDELNKLLHSVPNKKTGLGRGKDFKAHADSLDDHREGYSYKSLNSQNRKANAIFKLLGQMGISGFEDWAGGRDGGRKMWDDPIAPGQPGQPGINPPGPPPVGINPPPKNMLDLSGGMSGTMGMTPQQGGASTPTLGQTVQQQQFARQQQGATATGGGPSATQTASPSGVNNNLNATANTTPSTATPPASQAPYTPPDYGTGTSFGIGALTPGVTTEQLQSAVSGSPLLNTGPATAGQIFQAQYNPLINMAGQADIMGQLSTPGRSNVGGQYGTGGLANIAQQTAANQAVGQGLQGAQQLIAGNVQQQLGAQQLASQMDTARRQQQVQHLGAMLQPALSGVSSGFGQAIQGMTKMPQFLG